MRFVGSLVCVSVLVLGTSLRAEWTSGPADLTLFLQNATNAAHITAAIAIANEIGCDNPLEFRQYPGWADNSESVVLDVSCVNAYDAFGVQLLFIVNEHGLWFHSIGTIP